MHFSVDLPYRYADIVIHPQDRVYHPSQFPQTKYFDTTKRITRGKNRHDFVIYDKCRKCRLATPLTRIELRMNLPTDSRKLDDAAIRQKIAKKVSSKFIDIKAIRKRHIIPFNRCDWEQVITNVILYIEGHENLWRSIFSHRTDEITHSSELFRGCLSFCREKGIFSNKPQLSDSFKEFSQTLTAKQRHMINQTIASYNAYDRHWHEDFGNFGLAPSKKTRLNASVYDRILFWASIGETHADIARELNVSESTISRWLGGHVRLRKSQYLNIVQFQ